MSSDNHYKPSKIRMRVKYIDGHVEEYISRYVNLDLVLPLLDKTEVSWIHIKPLHKIRKV